MNPRAVIYCVECGVSMSLSDVEFAVETDEGPVHRECFEGPVPVGGASVTEVIYDEADGG